MSPRAGFLFILVTLLIAVLGIGLVIPVLPRLVTQMSEGTDTAHLATASLSASSFTYGVFVAVYAAMQFVCAPILGSLSDRFGRRPVLLVAIAGTAADYVLLTFAPTLLWLFVGRVIAGVTAASITTCNAYIADVTAPENRAKAFGMFGAVFGIGFALGPFLGGILGEYHLRLPFAAAALLAFINFLYGLFVLPESLPKENRRAFSWAKSNPLGSLRVLSQFHGVIPIAAVMTLVNLGTFSLHSVWVLYTAYRFDWTPRDVGLSLGFVGVLAILVQGGLTGRVVKLLGEHRTMYLALASTAIAFSGYGLATAGWMMYPAMIFGAVGGLLGPAAQALITKQVGPDKQGLAQGALSSLSALCAVAAPLAATALFAAFTGPHAPLHLPGISFLCGTALTLLALGLALTTVRTPHPQPPALDVAPAK